MRDSAHEIDRIDGEILTFIEQQFSVPPEIALNADTHLFRTGVVDSLDLLLLVRFIEEHYELSIASSDLVLENFQSAASIKEFVARKKQV